MHGLSWLSSLPPSNWITPATHRSASRDVPAKNHCNHQMIHNAKSRAKKRTNIQVLSWNYPKCQRKMQKPWFCPIGMRDILYRLIPFCFLYYRLSSYIYIYVQSYIIYIYIIQYMYIYILPKKKAQVLRRCRISDTHSNVSILQTHKSPPDLSQPWPKISQSTAGTTSILLN